MYDAGGRVEPSPSKQLSKSLQRQPSGILILE